MRWLRWSGLTVLSGGSSLEDLRSSRITDPPARSSPLLGFPLVLPHPYIPRSKLLLIHPLLVFATGPDLNMAPSPTSRLARRDTVTVALDVALPVGIIGLISLAILIRWLCKRRNLVEGASKLPQSNSVVDVDESGADGLSLQAGQCSTVQKLPH